MMAFIMPLSVAAMLLPSILAAQLTITASPNPKVVEVGSTLSFTAYVPLPDSDKTQYAMRCSEPATGCGYTTSYAIAVTAIGTKQKLAFKSYMVPASVKVGAALCFEVYRPGTYVKDPYSGVNIRVLPAVVVANACKQVSAPDVTAQDGAKAEGVAFGTATSSLPSPGTRTATSGGTRMTSTARSAAGTLPDLVISFEKAPVAKWIVRNVGTAKAPATFVEFRRLGVTGSKSQYVGGLAPGASAVIMVTPELDIYLVNSTADVDPSSKVQELDETNNRWTSAQSR